MFSSKHLMESDLSGEEGGGKQNENPLKHKHLILVLCLSQIRKVGLFLPAVLCLKSAYV